MSRDVLQPSAVLRRIDRVPFGWALIAGCAVGSAVAAAWVFLPGAAGSMVVLGVIALAGWVAWSAQPVGIFEEAAPERPPPLDMVAIRGGTFLMGSPENEKGRLRNERQHRVTLSPFEMSRTTMTRAQYREILELEDAPGLAGDDHPVTGVSWFDAVAFCNRLSERDGLEPCYRIQGEDVAWVEDAGGYRLPTEAEWEYAARAGSGRRWCFGDDEDELARHAWYAANSGNASHPVAELEPNAWGLYDMHGNVWEWCWDGFAEYETAPAADPRGPESLSARVLRGGAFNDVPWLLRSAYRGGCDPRVSLQVVGFRCVRRPLRQR